MAKKNTSTIKFSSYRHHQIFYDKATGAFMVAIKRDGTDDYFRTYDEAMDAIDRLEDKDMTMYEKMQERENEIWDRLDNLEGCEDNPVYARDIKELREELSEIHDFFATEMF